MSIYTWRVGIGGLVELLRRVHLDGSRLHVLLILGFLALLFGMIVVVIVAAVVRLLDLERHALGRVVSQRRLDDQVLVLLLEFAYLGTMLMHLQLGWRVVAARLVAHLVEAEEEQRHEPSDWHQDQQFALVSLHFAATMASCWLYVCVCVCVCGALASE